MCRQFVAGDGKFYPNVMPGRFFICYGF